jgi:hypothetical protein
MERLLKESLRESEFRFVTDSVTTIVCNAHPFAQTLDYYAVIIGTEMSHEMVLIVCLRVLCRGKEQMLPDGSRVTTLYYSVRYNAYPDTTDVLNGSSLRIPPMRADDDAQSAAELAEEMRQLFDSVRTQ